jgi:hypothetical protein
MGVHIESRKLLDTLSEAEREINFAREALLLEFAAYEATWINSSPKRRATESRIDDRVEAADAALRAISVAKLAFTPRAKANA